MKYLLRSLLVFLFIAGIATQRSFSQFHSIHEKPVIADAVPNIPEELIQSGKLSKYVALSLPDDDRWDLDKDNLNTNGVVFAIGQGNNFRSCYIGGHFDSIGGIPAKGLAFFDDNMKIFSEVGGGVQGGDVYAIIPLQSSNELYVAGNFTKAGDVDAHNIAHWTGSKWESLGSGTDSTILSMVFVANVLYVGGNFRMAGGQTANYIASWDPLMKKWLPVMDGAINGLNGGVASLAVTSSGDLYVGGGFTQAGSVSAKKIAMLNGKWNSLLTGVTGTNSVVYTIKILNGNDILVGGDFSTVGILPAGNIAFWSQNSWQNNLGIQFTKGFDKPVHIIGDVSNNSQYVYIGGDFQKAGDSTANYIVQFINFRNWLPMGSGLDGPCYALAGKFIFVSLQGNFGNHVYVGGKFNNAGLKQSQNFAIWGESEGGTVKQNPSLASQVTLYITPNPVQTSAALSFTLPDRMFTSVSIFDALGREVLSLGGDWREAGVQELRFDVKNLPSGAYYCRLTSLGQTVINTFIVTR